MTKIFIFFLIVSFPFKVIAQEEDIMGDDYMRSIMNAMTHKYEFKSTTEPLNLSFNLYDVKKHCDFEAVDSVLFKTQIPIRAKFLAGFGKFTFLPGVPSNKKKRSPLHENDAIFVFLSYGNYFAMRTINYDTDVDVSFYKFVTTPMVFNKEVPIALAVNSDAIIDKVYLQSLLSKQNLSSITIKDLKQLSVNLSFFKIITYKLQ